MAEKPEQGKDPPQPPHNVITQNRLTTAKVFQQTMIAYTGISADDLVRSGPSSLATPRYTCKRRYTVRIRASASVSKHRTDLGQVTVDPFRIVLKQDARHVKQKPYCHSPVLAAKVRTDIDKLLLAGILHRSYPNWARPLGVVAKSDGRIQLTCNYKIINEQSIISILPLPVVDNLV